MGAAPARFTGPPEFLQQEKGGARKPANQTRRAAPRDDGKAKPQGQKRGKGKPRGKDGGKPQGNKPQTFSARPAKPEKKIDPDNPFAAALAGLKTD